MAFGKKGKKQAMIVGGFLVVTLVGFGFIFRDRFIPTPSASGEALPEPVRFSLPSGEAQKLFDREDYKKLKQFGEVPVVPKPSDGSEPFATEP